MRADPVRAPGRLARVELPDFDAVLRAREVVARLRTPFRHTHNLAEGAGAAALAAIDATRESLRGRRVAMVLSGGNLDAETLRRVLTDEI